MIKPSAQKVNDINNLNMEGVPRKIIVFQKDGTKAKSFECQ
jgi:hypothetical protein